MGCKSNITLISLEPDISNSPWRRYMPVQSWLPDVNLRYTLYPNVPFVCLFPNYWSAVNCYLCSAHRHSPFCGRGQEANMCTIYKPHFEDSIYAQKAQLIFSTMHKRLETIWYAFIAALKDFYVSTFFSLKLKK